MSEETKTEPKTVYWKNLPVNGAKGPKWQDLHDEVVRLTKNHGIDEWGNDQSTQSSGDTRGMEQARQIHDTLRAWEKQKQKEKIIKPEDRVHHHAIMGFGKRYMVSAPEDGYKHNTQTTKRKEKHVVYLGGKKRKTKRKKTKRKKRKTKRRKKTRKHKRRKKRKTKRR